MSESHELFHVNWVEVLEVIFLQTSHVTHVIMRHTCVDELYHPCLYEAHIGLTCYYHLCSCHVTLSLLQRDFDFFVQFDRGCLRLFWLWFLPNMGVCMCVCTYVCLHMREFVRVGVCMIARAHTHTHYMLTITGNFLSLSLFFSLTHAHKHTQKQNHTHTHTTHTHHTHIHTRTHKHTHTRTHAYMPAHTHL